MIRTVRGGLAIGLRRPVQYLLRRERANVRRNLSETSRSPKIDVMIDVVSRYVRNVESVKDEGKTDEKESRNYAIYRRSEEDLEPRMRGTKTNL